MATKLTTNDFRQSLTDHVAFKAEEIRQKYGPHITPPALDLMLQDHLVVRYPCQIVYSKEGLLEGEFAHPFPLGERPEAGYELRVHPHFQSRPEAVVILVLYQLVLVNYGDFAGPADAETFGAGILGMNRESYYQAICSLADEVALSLEPSCSCGC